MPEQSEIITVPGNRGLFQAQRDARSAAAYCPCCDTASRVTEARGPSAVRVTVHFLTPLCFGLPRAVELGPPHNEDCRLVDTMLKHVDAATSRRVERNEPWKGLGVSSARML